LLGGSVSRTLTVVLAVAGLIALAIYRRSAPPCDRV